MARLDRGGETEQDEGSGGGPRDGGNGYGVDGFAAEEKTLALIKPGVSELHSGESHEKENRVNSLCPGLRVFVTLKRHTPSRQCDFVGHLRTASR